MMDEHVTDEMFLRYAGAHSQYWLGRKKLLERSGSKISWNMWAAFFGIPWILYKGMWLYGILALGMVLGLYALNIDVELPLTVLGVLLGCFGNWMYVEHVKRRIARVAERIDVIDNLDRAV